MILYYINLHFQIVLKLLEEGAPFVLDSDGQTALHQAAAGGHADTVAALILGGCDASVQDFVSIPLMFPHLPYLCLKSMCHEICDHHFFSPLINSIFAPDKRFTVFSNTVSISPKYSITLTLRLAGHRGGKISSLLYPYVLYSKSVHP